MSVRKWDNTRVRNIPPHQTLSTVEFAEDEDGNWVFEINLNGSAIPLDAESAERFSKRLAGAVETMKLVKRDERRQQEV